MIVGFTGTQVGMTKEQLTAVEAILGDTYDVVTEFHHGHCIGADEEAAAIAQSLGIQIIAHPGDIVEKWAKFPLPGNIFLKPKPNLKRNHDIVDVCELLVATPKGPPQLRSGTWATIRYADKVGRKVIIVKPNGELYDIPQ